MQAVGQEARILSLAPSITELLFHIGAESQIVGRTDRCNFPSSVQTIPSVGSLFPPNLEAILRVKPDIVMMTSGNLQLKEKLRALGIPVYVTQTQTVRGIANQIEQLGMLTNRETAAVAKAKQFEAMLTSISQESSTARPKVYWEIWSTPQMSAGKSSFVNDIIRIAGGENIFADRKESWPTVTSESIVRRQPKVIFTVDREGMISKRKAWLRMMKIDDSRVIQIDRADILHRPTTRVIKGVRWVASILREKQ